MFVTLPLSIVKGYRLTEQRSQTFFALKEEVYNSLNSATENYTKKNLWSVYNIRNFVQFYCLPLAGPKITEPIVY